MRAESVLGLSNLSNISHEGEVLIMYFKAHPLVHEDINGFHYCIQAPYTLQYAI